MKKTWAGISVSLVVSALLSSCEGPAGPTGPAGAAGPAGAVGATGPTGPAGDAGSDGTNGTNGTDGRAPVLQLLDARVTGWVPANRAALNTLLRDFGASSATFDPTVRPVAVFDWDNTVLKNDIGDATFFWMLKHDKVLQPVGKDWSTTNPNLSAAGKAALNAACDALAADGAPLPTSTNTACADALFHIYVNAQTPPPSPVSAWTTTVTLTNNNPYAWVSQLTAGYRPDEVRDFARAAFDENVTAPLSATQTVGTTTNATAAVRVYEPIRDLMAALHANGFDVWVVTASPQYVVDAIADEVGVPRDHVIGIRPTLVNGKITATFEGCGAAAEGNTTLITFDEGKRCWINKVIFHQPVGTQGQRMTDPKLKPAFVAGDSDTDIGMLKEATVLRLVINRNKVQTMCNGLANAGNRWLVQPMFLQPKAKKTSAYACSTATDPAGNRIVDESGNVFPADLSEPDYVIE